MALKPCRSMLGILIATCIVGPQSETHAADNRSIDDRFIRSGKAGREIRVRGYMAFKRDCRFNGYPEVLLDEPPQHGIVCLRLKVLRVQRSFFEDGPYCIGRRLRGVQVVYLPRSDFVGMDKMYYTVLFPTGRRRAVRTIFSVSPVEPRARDTVPPDVAAPMPKIRQSPGPVPFCAALVS